MKYYIVIGNKKGEERIEDDKLIISKEDDLEIIERDDNYGEAHKIFAFLDTQFHEDAQYGSNPTKTQESWLIGRHRVTRALDFGNLGYQFIRTKAGKSETTRIQFPDKITLSFDRSIEAVDDNLKKSDPRRRYLTPPDDSKRVDIKLSQLDEQLLHCYDKECKIDPIVFKLVTFDNFGDAYLDLEKLVPNTDPNLNIDHYNDFINNIEHFVYFMENYPNSNIFITCKQQTPTVTDKEIQTGNLTDAQQKQLTEEQLIKIKLKELIGRHHLTNYFEFCDTNLFKRRSPYFSEFIDGRPGRYLQSYGGKANGQRDCEYDTFEETLDEFFDIHNNQNNSKIEKDFYALPFTKAKITIGPNGWNVYAQSEKFKQFLKHNPSITLEIAGVAGNKNIMESIVNFVEDNGIKSNIYLSNEADDEAVKNKNIAIHKAVLVNRKEDMEALTKQQELETAEVQITKEENKEGFRLSLKKYAPWKLNLANVNVNVDLQVAQNQNQNQNQNQSQQLRQTTNAVYEPPQLVITNKTTIPDVKFASNPNLISAVIGLNFKEKGNAPQTETYMNTILGMMQEIVPAKKPSYCPLSFNIQELAPGAFYVPQKKLADLTSQPKTDFNGALDTLFFSPQYAAIAIKKDPYALKLIKKRPEDDKVVPNQLDKNIVPTEFLTKLMTDVQNKDELTKLLNKLYLKQGQAAINLLAKSLIELKSKNPAVYETLIQNYILTSKDLSEFIDDRYFVTFNSLAQIKDPKEIAWWNKLLTIQCKTNINFDLNHLVRQFKGFWTDLDKIQKFLPIPDTFPLNDFPDAGIALGKMHRIMAGARNKTEQIKSFTDGNISHAYMLHDVFHSSMYSKEMDLYCDVIVKELTVEQVLDKKNQVETFFSTKKLADMANDKTVSLAQLKSFLYAYAAVNGTTEKHNNSDLAFYETLFNTIDTTMKNGRTAQDSAYDESHKKLVYSAIMLFAAYGNNITSERTEKDIIKFMQLPNPIANCESMLKEFSANEAIITQFSIQNEKGKMVHSEAMPSLHTMVTLATKLPNLPHYKRVLGLTRSIIENDVGLSPAIQKILNTDPERLVNYCVEARNYTFAAKKDDRHTVSNSLFLLNLLINKNIKTQFGQTEFNAFAKTLESVSIKNLELLNELLVDVDYTTSTQVKAFDNANFSAKFIDEVSKTVERDELIFILEDYGIILSTKKANSGNLLKRIKKLESESLNTDEKKRAHYAKAYRDLIETEITQVLPSYKSAVDDFMTGFVKKIDVSFEFLELKSSFEALRKIVGSQKREDIMRIMSALSKFSIGVEDINPSYLLQTSVSLLTHIPSVKTLLDFMNVLDKEPSIVQQAKLQSLNMILEELAKEPVCYEDKKVGSKLTKETLNQLEATLDLFKTVNAVEVKAVRGILASVGITDYLKLSATVASSTNLNTNFIKTHLNKFNATALNLLKTYPGCFSDILKIAQFDAELLNKITFEDAKTLDLVSKICAQELLLISRKGEKPDEKAKANLAKNIQNLLDRKLDLSDLSKFYSKAQLAHPSAETLIQLLDHYKNVKNDLNKAFRHYERDPDEKRPHTTKNVRGQQVGDKAAKEAAYEKDLYSTKKLREVLDKITEDDKGFEKVVRRNLLHSMLVYTNEIGFKLPAFKGKTAEQLSDVELKEEFNSIKSSLSKLRAKSEGPDSYNIWQNKKYQRQVCKLLALIRVSLARYSGLLAYSTQMNAIFLAAIAGDYQYAMQINTGEGKAMIATAVAIAMHTIFDKRIVVTTSNLSLTARDAAYYDRYIQWFDMSHSTVAATTQDKSKLNKDIIHTTASDYALCHGKDIPIQNEKIIFLKDETDYTDSHLMPAINSQSKQEDQDNWWVYEDILNYVEAMSPEELRRKSGQQVDALITLLTNKFNVELAKINKERDVKLEEIKQNKTGLDEERQLAARENINKEYDLLEEVYKKRIKKLVHKDTPQKFNTLIDSAIIALYAMKIGKAYEVIDHFEQGKTFKRIVPTEGGKPIVEGDVMYMYGIHQFLIQKTIKEHKGLNDVFLKPSELESTTYYNNYAVQAGTKSVGFTGTIPKNKYKMYEALISGGSDVIPPHKNSLRLDAVPFEKFNTVNASSDHVCADEPQLVTKLAGQIKAHDGPVLIYCTDKNECTARMEALQKQLAAEGYTVQRVIPGVTEDFTDGDKLTESGRKAQNEKTVTLTVGDGRGVDIKSDRGLLTICSFVPETPEKLLQIYGRSGRNGQEGKTNLFIMKNELNKYGVTFDNLDKEFKFLDKIRRREFDFAIKQIGFMQYHVQKSIQNDPEKRTSIIGFMDDEYNRLLLEAVAHKIKNNIPNHIGRHEVSKRWEPFVMLSDQELNNIYNSFCDKVKAKLVELNLAIDVDEIKQLQGQLETQSKQARAEEKVSQKGIKTESLKVKLEKHIDKRKTKKLDKTVKLPHGIELNLEDKEVQNIYRLSDMNQSLYSKAQDLMQKYVGTHLGIHGFVNEDIAVPYEAVHKILETQKARVKGFKKAEIQSFNQLMAIREIQSALTELLKDITSKSKVNRKEVMNHLTHAGRALTNSDEVVSGKTLGEIRTLIRDHYKDPKKTNVEALHQLQKDLGEGVKTARDRMEKNTQLALTQCQEAYQQLQTGLVTEGEEALTKMQKPLDEMDEQATKSAILFSTLQMVTTQERQTEPVKKIINEIAREVDPKVKKYNDKVKEYQDLIYKQREALEFIKEDNNISAKLQRFDSMVEFKDVVSKNLVVFYNEFKDIDQKTDSMTKVILEENKVLEALQVKAENKKAAQAGKLEGKARNEFIQMVNQRIIKQVIEPLRTKIDTIEHPLEEAKGVALKLVSDLDKERDKYIQALSTTLETIPLTVKLGPGIFKLDSIKEVNVAFLKACDALINDEKTRSALERDLGWGPYLLNMMRSIVNAIIFVFTIGLAPNSFFLEKEIGKSAELVDESRKELESIINPDSAIAEEKKDTQEQQLNQPK